VDGREVQTVALGRSLRLADLTSRGALQFGVDASLGANERYEKSHAFAEQALQAGYAGIRYLLRHDPAQKLYGVSLFGPAGAPDSADPLWPCNSASIPDDFRADAACLFGYRVLPHSMNHRGDK
jgi:hypothetical protein